MEVGRDEKGNHFWGVGFYQLCNALESRTREPAWGGYVINYKTTSGSGMLWTWRFDCFNVLYLMVKISQRLC